MNGCCRYKISAYNNKVKKYKANMNRVTHAQCGVDIFVVPFFTLFFRYALSESKKYKLNCVNTMYDETCQYAIFFTGARSQRDFPPFSSPLFALFCPFLHFCCRCALSESTSPPASPPPPAGSCPTLAPPSLRIQTSRAPKRRWTQGR